MNWLVAIHGVWTDAGYHKPGTAFQAAPEIAAELRDDGSARDAEPHEIPTGEEAGASTPVPVLADLPPYHDLRMAAIGAAVATLGEADFTQAGNARLAALTPKLTFQPTGGEVFRAAKRPAT